MCLEVEEEKREGGRLEHKDGAHELGRLLFDNVEEERGRTNARGP